MEGGVLGHETPVFTSPQQIVDFSYTTRINAALENIQPREEDTAQNDNDVSMSSVESVTRLTDSSENMDTTGRQHITGVHQ